MDGTHSLDRWRIGVDLGGTKIAGVLLDAQDQVLVEQQVATPQGDYKGTVNAIEALVRSLLHQGQGQLAVASELTLSQATIGICTPGVRLPSSGLMANCNSVCLNGQPLLQDLTDRLGPDVYLANDADCFALSEWRLLNSRTGHTVLPKGHTPAATQNIDTLFGIILGTGVGGGFVHRGELLCGPNGLTGEWGHTPLPYLHSNNLQPDDQVELELKLALRDCYCGRANCAETFLSGPGLMQTHKELWGEHATPEEISHGWDASREPNGKLAQRHHSHCHTTFDLYLDMLSRALAQVINTLDPDCVVIGGGLSNIAGLYQELPQRLASYLFCRESCATPVLPPMGGASSGVLGAAQLGNRATNQQYRTDRTQATDPNQF